MLDEPKINSIDAWNAIQDMRKTTGWKLLMERYAKEGNDIMDDLLNINLIDIGSKYTKRDLLVYQLDALGRISKILDSFEMDAKNERDKQRLPPQKGIA